MHTTLTLEKKRGTYGFIYYVHSIKQVLLCNNKQISGLGQRSRHRSLLVDINIACYHGY